MNGVPVGIAEGWAEMDLSRSCVDRKSCTGRWSAAWEAPAERHFGLQVALATVATDTHCKYGNARDRKSEAEEQRSRRYSYRPQGDYAIADGAELKLSASATGAFGLWKWPSLRKFQVTPRSRNSNVGRASISLPLPSRMDLFPISPSAGNLHCRRQSHHHRIS